MTKKELTTKETYDISDFINIVKVLRSPEGCPWDRSQTHESMIICLIEECYEVIEAINNKDSENLKEELGDVLLQVVLHSEICSEDEQFELSDVIDNVCKKLVRRHPHVFVAGETETGEEAAHARWDAIKKLEHKDDDRKPLQSVPKSFPGLIRADKVLKKSEKEYERKTSKAEIISDIRNILDNIEMDKDIDENLGEMLLKNVDLARFLGKNAENVLTNSIEKFITRYEGQNN